MIKHTPPIIRLTRDQLHLKQEACQHEHIYLEGCGIHAKCMDCGKREVSRKQKGCEMQ